MGKINDVLCDYFSIAEHNADFWNSTEFYHRAPVTASQLTRCDREYYKLRHKKGKASSVRRDVLMRYGGKPGILLGMELMHTIDYTIPARIMDYDAQEIKRQLRDISRRNWKSAKGKKGYWAHSGEFLSGIRKNDHILPIHTVALYCGMEDYDGALDVLGLMDTGDLERDAQPYPNAYPFRIYSLRELSEERLQTSLREIVGVFKRCQDKEAMLEYYNMHKERFQQLDELSIETMGVLIGRADLKLFPQEEGGLDMCKAFRDAIEEGRTEGKRESSLEAIRNLMINLKFSAQQAMDALGIPENERAEYLTLI